MSDEEEDSVSEGFSASEDEWRPGKHAHDDGASSDDDDSDFEDSPATGLSSSGTKSQALTRKRETGKSLLRGCADGGGVAKKRKPMGQSLRAKLYNKYRPPPKTFPNSNSRNNSPTASTSRTASKNELTPNEVGYIDSDDDGSSSESSVGNHLVNPAELDLRSSFFNTKIGKVSKTTESPVFDCNAGIEQLTDSEPDDNNENSNKAFDFRNLLEKANSLERAKEQIAKRAAKTTNKTTTKSSKSKVNALDDVTTLLALGENQNLKHDMGAEEDDEDDDDDGDDNNGGNVDKRAPSKLSKTKSTRIKRHTKTRPTSQIITASGGGVRGGDTDDSDWEEVADENIHQSLSDNENLQIVVETGSRKRTKESKTQHELELAFKRRLNRDLKDQQLLKHKTSLLCLFGRSYHYNRLLNDLALMQQALKLLPNTNAYPRETGADLKYFQSFTTWFKTIIKLKSPNLYPEDGKKRKTAENAKAQLMEQIKKKEANSKQDMLFIYITLLRGMGIQCRLVVNMQPLPLKPSQEDLLPIKLKADDEKDSKKTNIITETKTKIEKLITKIINNEKPTTSKENTSFEKVYDKKSNKEKLHKKDEEEQAKEAKSRKTEKPKELQTLNTQITERESRTRRKVQKTDDKVNETANKKEDKTSLSQKLHKNEGKAEIEKSSTEKQTNKKIAEKEIDKPTDKDKQKSKSRENSNTKPKENVDSIEKSSSSRKKPTLAKLKRPITEAIPEVVEIKKSKNEIEQNEDINLMSTETDSAGDSGIHIEASSKNNSHNITDDKIAIPVIAIETTVEIPKSKSATKDKATVCPSLQRVTRSRSRSTSPRSLISTEFLQTRALKEKLSPEPDSKPNNNKKNAKATTKGKAKAQDNNNVKIATESLKQTDPVATTTKTGRVLRSRQNSNTNTNKQANKNKLTIPQLDGADDDPELMAAHQRAAKKRPKLEKLKKSKNNANSDSDFEPSPSKHIKRAPVLPKAVEKLRKDRRVLSTDNETETEPTSPSKSTAKKGQASDMWAEVWSDVENQWICVDIFKGKLHSKEAIRKAASSNLAYIFAFQNDLSLKDVTARYCPNWATIVRKNRVERAWLETAISPYYGKRTERDIREDEEMRQIHESKPLPTAISDFKDHPLYALERHLLKFQAIYPPNAPALGRTKTNEAIFSRDCVHLLHSREIWLKQARTVKLGEEPYKIVKARPKWDRLTQTVIKDQPLEIFGYWQTQPYEPPTAENGIVPRNAYGNVELFKECMLPKKTVHLRLPGLNRICKKLNIDCANAVVGFDFHQGACHPTFDGFVICEEFGDQVTAAWYQDQEEQEVKEREKYEARVYGNWKKLIKGLLIRERLKKKYNF